MQCRQALENRLAFGSQTQQHLTPVVRSAFTNEQCALLQLVDEGDGRMVLDAKSFGDGTDGGTSAIWQSTERQEQLVLLRLDARGTGRLLAERKELSYLVAEGSEQPVARIRQLGQREILGLMVGPSEHGKAARPRRGDAEQAHTPRRLAPPRRHAD